MTSHRETRNPLLKASFGITEAVNKAPFVGKLIITPLVKDAVQEEDIYVRRTRLRNAATVLSIFTFGHLPQAGSGIEVLQGLQNHQSLLNHPLSASIAFLYVAANIGASFAQANILYTIFGKMRENNRTIRERERKPNTPSKWFLRRKREEGMKTPRGRKEYYSWAYKSLSIGFTLASLLLFDAVSVGLIQR